ncbi:hypothetical protein Acr_06g0008240 [Actinidia rufa]|uniref:Uncharacterized protein n=1 Tax=Actinidia rufa TaxID=165716 RepID=A0A7J0EQW8_9ERIC|nr:hypothetical protein Acr_06g0008240 [Actinidia rufa]
MAQSHKISSDHPATFNDPGPGNVDSGHRTPKALDLNLLRVNVTPTSFPITRRPSYKLSRHLPDLQKALPSLIGPSTDAGTFGMRVVDMWLRIWALLLCGGCLWTSSLECCSSVWGCPLWICVISCACDLFACTTSLDLFAALFCDFFWCHSFRLFLGGKGKTGWILGHHPKPATFDPTYPQWDIDNYTICMRMLTMIPEFLSYIKRLLELHRRPWDSLLLDYFGFHQSRWEELAQYEPLSDFPATVTTIVSQQLARQHTYQFLMGLKSEYESLRIQILNTSPLPSLYEAFAIIDGDERCCRLLQASSATSSGPLSIVDQMASAVSSGLGPHSSGGRPICSYCENTDHISERCFKLRPELREQVFKHKWKGHPRTATVADITPGHVHVPDLSQIQAQFEQAKLELNSKTLQARTTSLRNQSRLGEDSIRPN